MRIAFFGGTFDPPHRGHLAIARAAIERLGLDRIWFVPVAAQPLKADSKASSFEDRFTMVELAVAGDPRLIASRADAPRPGGRPNYTFETLVEVRRHLAAGDRLFCLLGADSFLNLKQWHRCAELLLFCDFIVAGRPGFSLDRVAAALPSGLEVTGETRRPEFVRFDLNGGMARHSTLYLLPDLDEDISATEIRMSMAGGSEPQTILPPDVAAYIREHGLYR